MHVSPVTGSTSATKPASSSAKNPFTAATTKTSQQPEQNIDEPPCAVCFLPE